MGKNRKASLSVIFLTVFIDLMGFGILIPILPTFASKDLGVSDFGIGIIVAVYSLMQFLFNPVFGRISDKIGRRPVITVSLLFTATSYVIFAFANSFWILFLSRMLAGIGGSNIGVAQAYIADVTDKRNRSKGMGLIGAAFGLGFVFGPMIGGFLSDYGYTFAGLGAAAFSTMAFFFSLFFLPESNFNRDSARKVSFKLFEIAQLKKISRMPFVGLLILVFFIIVFSMANIYGTFALLGYKVYHLTDKQNGIMFGIMGLTGALMQGGAIRFLTEKFRDKTLVLFGTFFMMIGLTLLPYGGSLNGLIVVSIVLSIGTGVSQPVILALVSKYSPDNEQGSILGLNQSVSAFARVLGPLWGGFAFQYMGYSFPFLTGGFFTFVTLIILIFLFNPQKTLER